jgi:hypothetical protein
MNVVTVARKYKIGRSGVRQGPTLVMERPGRLTNASIATDIKRIARTDYKQPYFQTSTSFAGTKLN